MDDDFKEQKLLQEFDAEDHRLDLLAVTIPAGMNRRIRDEIRNLSGDNQVTYLNIEADAVRASITGDPVTVELVRKFEDAGWGWS
jgi:hypothetical protein